MARKPVRAVARKVSAGISIPFALMQAFDEYCEQAGMNRSEAVMRMMLDVIENGHIYQAPQDYRRQLEQIIDDAEGR